MACVRPIKLRPLIQLHSLYLSFAWLQVEEKLISARGWAAILALPWSPGRYCNHRYCTVHRYDDPNQQLASATEAHHRSLFTERRLKIDKYRAWRAKWASQRKRIVNSVREKVRRGGEDVGARDLRDFLAVVEDEDLGLLDAALRKVHRHGGEERGYSQDTGIIMTYYCLNRPDEALAMLRDEELSGYFSHASCLIVAMQLLYNVARYGDIVDFYKSYRYRHPGGGFPSMCTTLLLASCYILNSREGLEVAVDVLDGARGDLVARHAALAGGLALRRERYRLAAEISCGLERLPHLNLITVGCAVRSIQLISLAKSGRMTDAVDLLSQYATTSFRHKSPTVCREMVDELMELVETSGVPADRDDMARLYKKLELEGRFDARPKLEEILLAPIDNRITPEVTLGNAL